MHYDVVVIGAGMSGLAAGIRSALFGKRVCIVEKHYAYGGLNSYYRLDGRDFDVGLHALTNYVGPEVRSAPLPKLLRRLRLSRSELDLREQGFSEIRFPGRRLRFTNNVHMLIEEVAREFPSEAERFRSFIMRINETDVYNGNLSSESTRALLRRTFREPVLGEMLLCPVMYYGAAAENDIEFRDFAILFKSIFCEGLARPRGGIRTILRPLVRSFRAAGGRLMMRRGVERIRVVDGRVRSLELSTGEVLTADAVLSCAGYAETMRLCSGAAPDGASPAVGHVSFVESILVLDRPPAALGQEATIIFFNDAETFTYAKPDEAADTTSGVICCPNNYQGHEDMAEGIFRLTWLASYERWAGLDAEHYAAQKRSYLQKVLERAEQFMPTVRDHVVFHDMFTPRTIHAFTGHVNGAVYGSPVKRRDGRTELENLFICGTDQGLVGVVGALMSGVIMADRHVRDVQ
jgi:phytoene dehydrogenase-like protein